MVSWISTWEASRSAKPDGYGYLPEPRRWLRAEPAYFFSLGASSPVSNSSSVIMNSSVGPNPQGGDT